MEFPKTFLKYYFPHALNCKNFIFSVTKCLGSCYIVDETGIGESLRNVRYSIRYCLVLFYDGVGPQESWLCKYIINSQKIRFVSFDHKKRGTCKFVKMLILPMERFKSGLDNLGMLNMPNVLKKSVFDEYLTIFQGFSMPDDFRKPIF